MEDRKNLVVTEKTVKAKDCILLNLSADLVMGYRVEFFNYNSMSRASYNITKKIHDEIREFVLEEHKDGKNGVVYFYDLTLNQKKEQWEWGIFIIHEMLSLEKTGEVTIPVDKTMTQDEFIMRVFMAKYPEKAKEMELDRHFGYFVDCLKAGIL